jgi:hypothetical protein
MADLLEASGLVESGEELAEQIAQLQLTDRRQAGPQSGRHRLG